MEAVYHRRFTRRCQHPGYPDMTRQTSNCPVPGLWTDGPICPLLIGPSHPTGKLGPKNGRQAMFDPNKHLLAAEYLIGTFYPTEDSPPAAMSHDQATALATAHALLAIGGLLREISMALPGSG